MSSSAVNVSSGEAGGAVGALRVVLEVATPDPFALKALFNATGAGEALAAALNATTTSSPSATNTTGTPGTSGATSSALGLVSASVLVVEPPPLACPHLPAAPLFITVPPHCSIFVHGASCCDTLGITVRLISAMPVPSSRFSMPSKQP